MPQWDVAVVGAGPAGTAAALALVRAGARVALLERQRMPRYKTCGGGLVPRAWQELPAAAKPAVERECRTVDVAFTRPGIRLSCTRDALISMAMRAPLDHALANAAADAGADVRDGCTVTGIEDGNGRVTLLSGADTLTASFAIVADGATGAVARMAGWPQHAHAIPAIELECTPPDADFERLSRTARFDFDIVPHGYAWVFPKRNHLSIGVLSVVRGRVALREHLDRYLAFLGLEATGEQHGYVIPIRPRSDTWARGRIIIAGDAAGCADPVTAEGISMALRSGRFAAESILGAELDPARARTNYMRRVRREIADDLRYARTVSRVLYHGGRSRDALLRRRAQILADAVEHIFADEESWRGAMLRPRAWLRLLTR